MQLNFRQGIISSPLNGGLPSFLSYNVSNNTINISGFPTTISPAHHGKDFLIDERAEANNAWGPLSWNSNWGSQPVSTVYYLYWDINLATAKITRDYTPWAPVYATAAPVAPAIDQHWFDITNVVMNVWNGASWVPTIRVFAGYFNVSGASIVQYPLASQAGLSSVVSAGYIIYDIAFNGIKGADGEFLTTTTPIMTNHGSFTSPLRLELISPVAIAAEIIPAYSCVTSLKNGSIGLASVLSGLRPIGIVDKNLNAGDAADVIVNGLVTNTAWNWNPAISQELYCNIDGLITQTPSVAFGAENVRVGIALSATTAFINVDFYGSMGAQGVPGTQGLTGPAGPTGPSGPTGPAPSRSVITVTGPSYNVLATDDIILAQGAANQDIMLPVSGISVGKSYTVKLAGSGAPINVTAVGGVQIDSWANGLVQLRNLPTTTQNGGSVTVAWDGTQYWTIAGL
jgi:hypothetical protein